MKLDPRKLTSLSRLSEVQFEEKGVCRKLTYYCYIKKLNITGDGENKALILDKVRSTIKDSNIIIGLNKLSFIM